MNRQQLLTALTAVLPAVDTKAGAQDDAGCFRLKGSEVWASDSRIAVRAPLGFDSGLDCLAPADRLVKLLRDLTGDELEVEQAEGELKIKAGRSRVSYKLRDGGGGKLDAVAWPTEALPWTYTADLDKALRLCRFAASRDASKGPLCGVHVGPAACTATDSYRIAQHACAGHMASPQRRRRAEGQEAEITTVILPPEIVGVLDKQQAKPTAWGLVGGTAAFACGSATVLCQTLAGDYPAVDQFLLAGSDLPEAIELPAGLAGALRRHAAQLADIDDLDKEVAISLDGPRLLITSTDGVVYSQEEDMDLAAAAGKVAFRANPLFLADALEMTRQFNYCRATGMLSFSAGPLRYVTGVEWAG